MRESLDRWYSYFCFRFTREQIFWVLREASYFNDGRWPPEPQVDAKNNDKGEYITDVLIDDEKHPGKKIWVEQIHVGLSMAKGCEMHQGAVEGHFVKPCVIISEINKRLALTGKDGITLKQEIERARVKEIDELSDCARNALDYISWGKEARRRSYTGWLADKRYRDKYIIVK